MDSPDLLDSLFREAVTAIDAGDVTTLERLMAEHPRLLRDRLTSPGAWLRDKIGGALKGFFREPYLLWFVAEDAVRNGKLPGNIAQVTRALGGRHPSRADDKRAGQAVRVCSRGSQRQGGGGGADARSWRRPE